MTRFKINPETYRYFWFWRIAAATEPGRMANQS